MKQLKSSYALSFEGGGAKGAYEIGVWKALNELNIKIEAVVGTSVGALNGALFAQGNLDLALSIWENIRYSSVILVEDSIIEKLATSKWTELSLHELTQQIFDILKNKGLDITPLKELIEEMVDEKLLRESAIDFGLVTFNLTDFKPVEIMLKDIEPGQVAGYLLASAFLPSFRAEKIFGKRFLDGGFHNVVPTSMLVEQGFKDIIEVRVQGIGLEKKYDDTNVNILSIYANEDLGRILEFNKDKSKRNIELGYLDTLRAFRDYTGTRYYIEAPHNEASYLKEFIMLSKGQVEDIFQSFGTKGILRQYGSKHRVVSEELIPLVAKKLKLSKQSSYKDIYFAIMERLAGKLELEQLRVYTLDEFKKEINNALNETEPDKLEEMLRNDVLIEIAIDLGV